MSTHTTDSITDFAAQHFVLNQISTERAARCERLLRQFEQWLGAPIHTAEASDLRQWMTEQVAHESHVNTVRFKLGMLQPYFRWAWHDARLIDADTYLRIKEVKPPRGASGMSKPRPYKKVEISRFWAELEAHHTPLKRVNYYTQRFERGTSPFASVAQHFRYVQTTAIVSLALYEGLRRNEIYCLTMKEIHPDNEYLLVHGKRTDHREKTREVPYAPAARGAVEDWLALRRCLKPRGHESPWLALNLAGGKKPSRQMSEKQFNEMMSKIGLGYELHRFRHTFATERLRARMPIERLQRIMGHSRIQQTLAYAELVGEDLNRVMDETDAVFMASVGNGKRVAA